MNAYIYKFTLIPTGKIYVGQHTSDTFDEYYYGSGSIWNKALNKYGKENVHREILEWCYDTTKDFVTSRENYWINKLDALNPAVGYNQVEAVPNFWKGQTHSEETKELIGNISANRRHIHKGSMHKFIDKKYMPEYLAMGWELGTGKPVKHSQETLDKISKKNKGRVLLTDGNTVVRAQEHEIQNYLDNGFVYGLIYKGDFKLKQYMTNGTIEKVVPKYQQPKKLELGWVFGRLDDFSKEEIASIKENINNLKIINSKIKGEKISKSKMGHEVTESTRQKLRDANIGKKASEETKQKMSKSQLGKKHTEETKAKIGNAHRGKKASEETIKKLRESHLGSQSDRIWITDGAVTKRVTEQDFNNIYALEGFVKGRRIKTDEC